MNKRDSLLITSVFILLSIFYVVLPEKASSQVVVDDAKASNCNLIKNERLQKSCRGFKLIRARDEKIRVNGFRIEFLFDDEKVTFIAIINNNITKREINGKTFTFYPLILQTVEQRGLEPKSFKPEGICGISVDNSGVICQLADDSAYIYRGKPVSVQQNTQVRPERVVNSKKYTFQTNSYTSTGISVNPGDKIKVQASGIIRFGLFTGSGRPRGIAFNPEYNYFIDMAHGQLMGRVKQSGMRELDGWFPIGEAREFVVRTPGVLEFAVNDNKPGDNVGNFKIEVTIDSTRN